MKNIFTMFALVCVSCILSDNSLYAAFGMKNTLVAPDHVVARLSKSSSTMFVPVVTWRDETTVEDGFSVERKIGNATITPFTTIGQVASNVTTYTDTTAGAIVKESTSSSDISFIYRVSAFNQSGASSSNKAIVVSTYKARNPNATTSPQDFSVFTDYVKTKVENVNAVIQKKGGKVIDTFTPVKKVKASEGNCIDLKKNISKGSPVATTEMLQNFLIAKGLLPGEASGVYGDFTVEAVKMYQRSIGVKETGMVYEVTRKAIKEETCK